MDCSQAPPNTEHLRSAFFTRRDSEALMASADDGLSLAVDRYCGGRPVYAAACLASSVNAWLKLISSAAGTAEP